MKKLLISQSGFAPIIIFIFFGAALIGGATMVGAADNSKPGETLYPLKQAIESVQLTLAATPELQKETRVRLAQQRIEEVKQLLAEKEVDAPGLKIALANLVEQKQKLAELLDQEKTNGKTVFQEAKKLDNQFEQKEKELETAFKGQKDALKAKEQQLKLELIPVLAKNNKAKIEEIRAQLAEIEKQLEAFEAQEDQIDEALEQAEKQIEAQMEVQEQQKEEKEKQLEKQKEEKGTSSSGEED